MLKPLYKAQKRARQKMMEGLDALYYWSNVSRAYRHANAALSVPDANYRTYLREQLEETLRKKTLRGRDHIDVVPLIDMLASKYDIAQKSILCVGCRDTDEIRYFRKRGAERVVGIDLYSDDPDILVMDMHDLKFADGSFDVVYSRHSFEHAYDKTKAGHEFVRVLRDQGVVVVEVPGKYKGGGDYNFFDGIDDVLVAFKPFAGRMLWQEYSRKEENPHKMDIIRVMFHIDKTKTA
jgi:SAM-dependent methyltransferase